MMFRTLDDKEIEEFKQWARDNYKVGDEIEEAIWHPVVCDECGVMNRRALRARIKQAMMITWGQIQGDVYDLPGVVTTDVAIEMTIDADRLLTYGHDREAATAFYSMNTTAQESITNEVFGSMPL